MKRTPETVENMLRYAKGTLKHEGIYLTSDEEDLLRKNLLGEISDEEFDRLVQERVHRGDAE